MKIYTKTGDDGTTGLFSGERISKASIRVDVYGTIDELNSVIGLITTKNPPTEIAVVLKKLNETLFIAGSDIATKQDSGHHTNIKRITDSEIIWLENLIDDFTAKLPPLKNFILPGGTEISALFQVARTICRRAERLTVGLSQNEELGPTIIKFLNRLSDFLFTLARYANFLAGVDEIKWSGS